MNYITTVTSKNQITLPKGVRERLKINKGAKLQIYPTKEGFIGRVKRKSKIFEFFGDLKGLDDGRPFKQIREQAQKAAAKER